MNILAENVLFFDPKVNNPRCPKNGKPLLPSWQGLTLRTSARTLGETRMALLVSTSFWFLLVKYTLSDPFPTVTYPRPLATSVSSNAKHVWQLCKQNKNCLDWPSFRKLRPLKLPKSALGKCDAMHICTGHKSLPFNFTFLFRMHLKIICWYT